MKNKKSLNLLTAIMLSLGFVFSQPGGDWTGTDSLGHMFNNCEDLTADMCEMMPFCEMTANGECVETDWDGWGGNDSTGWGDWTPCYELGADECATVDYCTLNDAGECTYAHDGGWGDTGGDWTMDGCADLSQEECEEFPFCELTANGDCIEVDWNGGGDSIIIDLCAFIGPELCDSYDICELTDAGDCVSTTWDGWDDGSWDDWTPCEELSVEECVTVDYCVLNDANECTYAHDGGWGDTGGDWTMDGCEDLDVDMCEMMPFCELTASGECVEAEWDGGWNHDIYFCEYLSADECNEVPFCFYTDSGDCVEADVWITYECSDLGMDMCEHYPYCTLLDDGSCVESDWDGWGMGHCGNESDVDWGCGTWDWEEGGFTLGDINVDQFINVTDIINQVNIIIDSMIPTDYESWAADMNIDEFIDILDVVSLINDILGNRVSFNEPTAKLSENLLQINGDVGGLQFNGSLKSQIIGDDILVIENGKTIVYNLSGVLETESFELNSNYSELMIASSIGKEIDVTFADQFSLNGNYPNPFNPETTIFYSVNQDTEIKISIYNLLGEKVVELVNDYQLNGSHSFQWNAINNPSGLYIVEMVAGNKVVTKIVNKIIFIC